MYLLAVNLIDYEQCVNRYTDQEWEDFWCSLTNEEQKMIPKTREEQLIVIRDTYYAYREHIANASWFYGPQSKAPHSCDLEKFRAIYHQDPHDAKTNDPWGNRMYDRYKFTRAYLLRRKYELFNMP